MPTTNEILSALSREIEALRSRVKKLEAQVVDLKLQQKPTDAISRSPYDLSKNPHRYR